MTRIGYLPGSIPCGTMQVPDHFNDGIELAVRPFRDVADAKAIAHAAAQADGDDAGRRRRRAPGLAPGRVPRRSIPAVLEIEPLEHRARERERPAGATPWTAPPGPTTAVPGAGALPVPGGEAGSSRMTGAGGAWAGCPWARASPAVEKAAIASIVKAARPAFSGNQPPLPFDL